MNVLNDFSTSVKKALTEIDPSWERYNGLIVCGTHNPRDIDKYIGEIKNARENKTPFLGICMGFQLMIIEWVRHLGWADANSSEIDPNSTTKMFVKLPEVRVGIRNVYWRGKESQESHWHNYAFARKHSDKLGKEWELSYTDGILEVARLRENPFFLGTQFHPEYQSSKDNPHPLLKEFIEICKKKQLEKKD